MLDMICMHIHNVSMERIVGKSTLQNPEIAEMIRKLLCLARYALLMLSYYVRDYSTIQSKPALHNSDKMIRKVLCLARYALLAALTISHFCFFGLPALQKFQQGEQMMSRVTSYRVQG